VVVIPLYQIDAFTDSPLSGNPAAVCLLPAPAGEAWMQAFAAEMNLSEAAFLWPEADGWRLRWVSPTVEVDLCGHATLASAHALWHFGHLPRGAPARFLTKSGPLTATEEGGWVGLDFPALPAAPAEPASELVAALGVQPTAAGRSRFDWLVEVQSEAEVRAATPDRRRLLAFETRGVIVTAPGERHDLVSRLFAPAAGVDEDPVTGSAHCTLAPWWSAKLGKDELVAWQASRRGGTLRVRLAGDRVTLLGQAATVFAAHLERDAGPYT
jgi:PhzF family phenazine biosynthesis protein